LICKKRKFLADRVAQTLVRITRCHWIAYNRTSVWVAKRQEGGEWTSCASHTDTCPNEVFLMAESVADKCRCYPTEGWKL